MVEVLLKNETTDNEKYLIRVFRLRGDSISLYDF